MSLIHEQCAQLLSDLVHGTGIDNAKAIASGGFTLSQTASRQSPSGVRPIVRSFGEGVYFYAGHIRYARAVELASRFHTEPAIVYADSGVSPTDVCDFGDDWKVLLAELFDRVDYLSPGGQQHTPLQTVCNHLGLEYGIRVFIAGEGMEIWRSDATYFEVVIRDPEDVRFVRWEQITGDGHDKT